MSSLGAIYSDCQRYRYVLHRQWSNQPAVAIVGLNGSTASHENDDPTARRAIGFAKREGFGGIVFLNLFGFRATDPEVMKRQIDPVGPMNDYWIAREIRPVRAIWCCWGGNGSHMDRAREVSDIISQNKNVWSRVLCFGKNADGSPRHPLYLKSSTPLEHFSLFMDGDL